MATLALCDFCIWGSLRHCVYARTPRNKYELTDYIEEEITSFMCDNVEKFMIPLFIAVSSVLNRKVPNLSHCSKHCLYECL